MPAHISSDGNLIEFPSCFYVSASCGCRAPVQTFSASTMPAHLVATFDQPLQVFHVTQGSRAHLQRPPADCALHAVYCVLTNSQASDESTHRVRKESYACAIGTCKTCALSMPYNNGMHALE